MRQFSDSVPDWAAASTRRKPCQIVRIQRGEEVGSPPPKAALLLVVVAGGVAGFFFFGDYLSFEAFRENRDALVEWRDSNLLVAILV